MTSSEFLDLVDVVNEIDLFPLNLEIGRLRT